MKGSEAMGTGGRPPKYKSVKTMQKKIDEYFKLCEGEVLKEDGKIVRNKSGYPIMLTGNLQQLPDWLCILVLHLERICCITKTKNKSFLTQSHGRKAEWKSMQRADCTTKREVLGHSLILEIISNIGCRQEAGRE